MSAGGVLGGGGPQGQSLRIGLDAIVEIQRRQAGRDLLGQGQAGVTVLRHRPGDAQGMLDQPIEAGGIELAGGDDRLALTHEHAQAQIVAFGALDLLELAQALGHGQRPALDQQRVGGIGAGRLGAAQEVVEQVGRAVHGLSPVRGARTTI